MSQHDHDDFAQLRGNFDHPITPSPQFAAKLREDLVSEMSASRNDRIRLNVVSSPVTDSVSRVQTLTANGWQGALMTAAAIIIVLSLGFASLRYVNEPDPGDDLNGITYNPLASATPEPESTTDLGPFSDGFGGADRSFNLGPSTPNLTDEATLVRAAEQGTKITFTQVIGDLLLRNVHTQDEEEAVLEAISLETGEIVWTFNTPASGGYSTNDSNLFLWSYPKGVPGQLTALNLQTGQIVWQLEEPMSPAGFAIGSGTSYADGLVYAGFGQTNLMAIDANTGTVVWLVEHDRLYDRSAEAASVGESVNPDIAISGNTLVVTWEDRLVESLDRTSGERNWIVDLYDKDNKFALDLALAVDGQNVYVSSIELSDTWTEESEFLLATEAPIRALDSKTGETIWTSTGPSGLTVEAVAGSDLISSYGPHLYAVDKATGESRVDSYAVFGNTLGSHIASFDDSIFVFSDNQLLQINSRDLNKVLNSWNLDDGANVQNASEEPGYPHTSTPQLWKDRLVISSPSGTIWIINPQPNPVPVSTEATPEPITTDATPEPASDTNADIAIGGIAGSDRSNQIGDVNKDISLDIVSDLNVDAFGRLNPAVSGVFGDMLVTQPVPMGKVLQGFDLQTRELVWQYEGVIATGLASDGNLVFGYNADATIGRYGIVAIDLDTGIEQWFYSDPTATGEEFSGDGPVVADGLVFMNDGADTFYALSAADGSLVWQTTLDNELSRIVTMYEGRPGVYSLPPTFAIDQSLFYTLTGNQYLSALDLTTGGVVWNTQLGTLPDLGSRETTLSTRDGTLFIASRTAMLVDPSPTSNGELEYADSVIQAVDGSSGELKWTSDIPAYLAPPVVAGGMLIVPTDEGIVTLNRIDGTVQATLDYGFELPEPYFADKVTIRVSDDLVYISVATNSGIQILMTDGVTILQRGLIPVSPTSAASYPVAMYAYDGDLLVLPRDSAISVFKPASEYAPAATPEVDATPESATVSSCSGSNELTLNEESLNLDRIPSRDVVSLDPSSILLATFESSRQFIRCSA